MKRKPANICFVANARARLDRMRIMLKRYSIKYNRGNPANRSTWGDAPEEKALEKVTNTKRKC